MDNKVADLLREQVTKEFYSAYLYLAMSNFYYEKNLDGFGKWFEIQAQEEATHAMKFIKYLQDNSEKVELGTIDAPDANFADLRAPLIKTLEHEKYVTGLINAIYKQAKITDDFRCCQFLDWFIAEQGEEEKTASNLIAKYDLVGGDAKGLYILNTELGSRTFTADTAAA